MSQESRREKAIDEWESLHSEYDREDEWKYYVLPKLSSFSTTYIESCIKRDMEYFAEIERGLGND